MRKPAIRPSRKTMRKRPRVVKGLIRIAVGPDPSILYLAAGTNNSVKLLRDDVEILETDTRKQIEEMTEDELVQAMGRLNIKSIDLTDDEKLIVMLASKYVLAGYFILKE